MPVRFPSLVLRAAITAILLLVVTSFANEKIRSLVSEGKYKEALQLAEEKVPSAERDVQTWILIGQAHQGLNASEAAEKAFEAAQKVNPSDPEVYLALGQFKQAQKQYKEAIKHFQKSYILDRTAAAAEGIAICATELKDMDKARDAAESAVKLDPKVLESRLILADIYLGKKNFDDAAKQLEVICSKKPKEVKYWKQLALCYDKTNDADNLARADAKIVKLDKKNINSRRRLAEYTLAKKDTTTSFELLKELAVLTPKDAKVFKLLYQISANQGQSKGAILYLKNFLALDSTVAGSHRALADLLYEQKEYDEALQAYRKALQLDPKLKGFYKRYETIVLKKNLEDEAVKVIRGAIQAGEADAKSYIALGRILKKKKDYPGAIKAFKEALKTETKNVKVLTALGESQAENGDIAGAIVTYEQVILMNPKAVEEIKVLGDLQMKNEKTKNAISSYKKYLKKKPSDEKIARTVGLYEFDQENFGEAIKYLTMVKDPKNQNQKYLIALGKSYFETKDYKNASVQLAKARTTKPTGKTLQSVLKLLGESYQKTGNAQKAADAYEAYTSLPGVRDADAAFLKAFLRENTDIAAAIAAYQANTKAYPKDHRNFQRLGMIYSEDEKSLKKSARMLTYASKIVDTIPEVWSRLGLVSGQLNDEKTELMAYQKLLKLQPDHLQGNKRVGMILLKSGETTQALTHLETALTLSPKDSEIMLLLAEGYNTTKRPEQAAKLLAKAKSLKPSNVDIRLSLISTLSKAGKKAEMEKERDELAELDRKIAAKDKKDIEARQRLAKYYLDRKMEDKAYEVHKALAILTPKESSVFKNLYHLAAKKNQKKDAVLYLKNYLVLDSTDATYHRALGNLLYERKDFDGALESYRTALKIDPKIKGFYKNYETIVLKKKLEDEAVKVIKGAIAAKEADAESYIALGDIYREQKQYANAIDMYQEALKTDTKNVEVMTALAECQAANDDLSGAIVTYEQVVLMNPKAVEEFKELGDLQMKVGKKDAAIGSYKKYLAKNPKNSKIASIVGLYEYDKKNYKEAVSYLEMVKETDLHTVKYLAALGESYYEMKDFGSAAKTLAALQKKNPSTSIAKSTLKLLAESYRKIGSNERAAKAYDSYTSIKGVVDPDASYLRAELRRKTDLETAVKIYESNTKRFPKDHRNFLALGIIYSKDKKTLENSASNLSQASTLIDSLPVLWKTMGEVYGKLGNEDRELTAYKKLLTFEPQNLRANRRCGMIQLKKGKTSSAIANLETALTMAPKDSDIMLLLADGYMKTERPKQAAELLAKAREIDAKDPKIRMQLYTLYEDLGRKNKAEEEIKGLIALTNENTYRAHYARDLLQQKRNEDALKQVKQINASAPSDIEGLMLLAQVQRSMSQFAEAIETYKAIGFVAENHVPAMYERAETYLMMQQPDRAKEYYERTVKAEPKNALAYLGLAKAAKMSGDNAAYKSHLAKAKSLDPKNKVILAEESSGSATTGKARKQ